MAELQKGVALRWAFKMKSTTDGSGVTGLTPSPVVSKDGGSFAALTGSPAVSEIGVGWYYVDVPAADMNADVVILRATGAGAAPAELELFPPTKIASDLNDFDHTSEGVIVGSNTDKSGYLIAGTKTALDDLNDFDPSSEEVSANLVKVYSSASAAQRLAEAMDAILYSTVAASPAPSTTSITLSSGVSAANHYRGKMVVFLSTASIPRACAWVESQSGLTLTITPLGAAPAASDPLQVL